MKEKTFELVATAASGLEALVGKELRNLGIECQVENGRARFKGTVETIAKANLWLRTADRIKIVVGEFDAHSFDELFEKVKALPWEDYLPLDAEFPLRENQSSQNYIVRRIVKLLQKKQLLIVCVNIIIVLLVYHWLKQVLCLN